jgi:HK97 family phage major capsid protein
VQDYIKRQHDLRQAAWHEAKHLLEEAAKENRDLSAEEQEKYDRISGELDQRAQVIEQLKADEERAARLDAVAAEVRTDEAPASDGGDSEVLRRMARGEVRSHEFGTERRDILTSTSGSPVPTSFYDQMILKARLVGPMLDTSTILNTASGENLQIPSLNTYSTATVATQGGTITESDPTFNAFTTLSAYRVSFIVQASLEMVEDSGIDFAGFLADQAGNELGFRVNNLLTVGTGTVEPNGIVTASGSGITGGTGVTGAFTADNLIDLVYSLDGAARLLPGVGWMMNGAAIGAVRKLKDSQGQFLFSPSLSGNARDMLLGYEIYENPAVASPGTAVKSVVFGHLPSYYVRQVGGIRVDRSDDFAFNTGLVSWRFTYRVDGNLVQTSHVKHFIGGTA